jgi:predicted dehydrogenase
VASRLPEKANAFGARFGVPARWGSYEELCSSVEIDAVYVATPHSCHLDNGIAALRGGKAVLVEKPFTLNAEEAETMVREAALRKLLVMEAMWTRFLPLYVELRRLLRERVIGEPQLLTVDFGISVTPESRPRLFDMALGGGALLDLGVYPISLASMLFGTPCSVKGTARFGGTGVDEQEALVLSHPAGQLAQCFCAITLGTSLEAALTGTEGRLHIQAPFWKSTHLTLMRRGENPRSYAFPFEGNGYQYEAAAFMECLRAGLTECPTMPLAETLSIMRTVDELRRQWNFVYPSEKKGGA